jgi:hypothetical protein
MIKHLLLTLGIASCAHTMYAQQFDLRDLVEFSEYNVQKFDAHLGRKDFKRDYNSPRETQANYNYYQVKKVKGEGQVRRRFSFVESKTPVVRFQTTSRNEFAKLQDQLQRNGFVCYQKNVGGNAPRCFQKAATSINVMTETDDSVLYYTMVVERAPLPKAKDIAFAEDLLQFTSHEVLKAVFGDENVTQDVFHYSESEKNNCSILFPNTSREVIFIWSDEQNFRKPDFLIVGGHLQTFGSKLQDNQLAQNEWRSRQGVFPGMKLEELQDLNGKAVSFYGWGSDQAGMLAPANKGKLDFSRIGLVFNCLDCKTNKVAKAKVIASDKALQESNRIYVSSMIILPDKDQDARVTRR